MPKPRPILDDMPQIIKERILQNTGPLTRYAVWFCSKNLQIAAMKAPISDWDVCLCKGNQSSFVRLIGQEESILLKCTPREGQMLVVRMSTMRVEEKEIEVNNWKLTGNDLRKRIVKRIIDGKVVLSMVTKKEIKKETEKVLECGKPHQELVFAIFSRIFRSTRITLRCLSIETLERKNVLLFQEVEQLLKTLREPLLVKSVKLKASLATQEDVLCILPYLKSEDLKTIEIYFKNEISYDRIVALPQFKQAKEFDNYSVSNILIDDLVHFKKLDVAVRKFSLEDCKKLITAANSYGDTFESFKITAVAPSHRKIERFLAPFKTVVVGQANNSDDNSYVISFDNTENEMEMIFDFTDFGLDTGIEYRTYELKPSTLHFYQNRIRDPKVYYRP